MIHRDEALPIVASMIEAIQDLCEKTLIGGSLRRGRSLVKDAELIVLPHDPRHLLARLDKLIATGQAKQARYGNDRTPRWGSKYRGLQVGALKVEIFLADKHNWGYQTWLRTGPGDANKYVMMTMQHPCSLNIDGGYVRDVESGKRIQVPNEDVMFGLLRLPLIPPSQRSVGAYSRMFQSEPPIPRQLIDDEPTPVQGGLL